MKNLIKTLLLVVFAVAMIGCKASTDDGSGSRPEPVPPKDRIKIGETTYEYTGEVQLMTTQATITGSDDYNQKSNYASAFPKGRTVTLSPFIMGKYEVTQELYETVMTGQTEGGSALNPNPSSCTSVSSDFKNMLPGEVQKYRPVESVTWFDACYFCNALSEKMGFENAYSITDITVSDGHITYATVTPVTDANGYRLPTEAEWEYAARGGATGVTNGTFANYFSGATTTNYSSEQNADLDAVGWYKHNLASGKTSSSTPNKGDEGYGTHQVGKKAPNAAGLYDMSGNVYEWCYDWRDSISTTETITNPSGPSSSKATRVRRGGAWDENASNCAVSYRDSLGSPNDNYYDLGFRVVRSAQ